MAPCAGDVALEKFDRDAAKLVEVVSAGAFRGRLEGGEAETVADVGIGFGALFTCVGDEMIGGLNVVDIDGGRCGVVGEEGGGEGYQGEDAEVHGGGRWFHGWKDWASLFLVED